MLIITTIVLLIERSSEDEDEVIKIHPTEVLRNIFLIQVTISLDWLTMQIAFYLLYLFITFTIFVASMQVFWPQQVFSFVDFSFYSVRGLMNFVSLILAFWSITIPLAALIPTYKFVRLWPCIIWLYIDGGLHIYCICDTFYCSIYSRKRFPYEWRMVDRSWRRFSGMLDIVRAAKVRI
jgi:hypothetical protein